MTKVADPVQLAHELSEIGALEQVNGWLARGDGVAVYENLELGHPELGHRQYVSYGSAAALFDGVDEPPQRLPDIGSQINWRYGLVGTYRGEILSAE